MVPEVLLALLGIPGEVIVLSPPSPDGRRSEGFRVSPDLPFITAPERASLDRLVCIGYAFKCLEGFVARENEACLGDATSEKTGGGSLYRRALATGVAEVLGSYEAAILRLEQDVLRGVTPAVPAALESALSGFALVLPALHATLRPVIESEGGGGWKWKPNRVVVEAKDIRAARSHDAPRGLTHPPARARFFCRSNDSRGAVRCVSRTDRDCSRANVQTSGVALSSRRLYPTR